MLNPLLCQCDGTESVQPSLVCRVQARAVNETLRQFARPRREFKQPGDVTDTAVKSDFKRQTRFCLPCRPLLRTAVGIRSRHTSTAENSRSSVPPVKLDRSAARRSLTGVTQLGGGQ